MVFNHFGNWLQTTFSDRADATAVTAEGTTLTYSAVDRRVRAIGTALRQKGLEAGDRVVFLTGDKRPIA